MKISTEEFNKFWDEVLGSDWYVEEGEYDEDGPVTHVGDVTVGWQGKGDPKPGPFFSEEEFDKGGVFCRLEVSLLTLFKRWKKGQTTATVVVKFEVPHEELETLLSRLKDMKGEILTSGPSHE